MTSAIAGTGSSSQVRVWAPLLRVSSTPSRPLQFHKWDSSQWDRPCVVAEGPHRGDRPLRTGNTGRLENTELRFSTPDSRLDPLQSPRQNSAIVGKARHPGLWNGHGTLPSALERGCHPQVSGLPWWGR